MTFEKQSQHHDAGDNGLQQALRQTLEAMARRPDAELDAALAATRARIATGSRPLRPPVWWLGAGFALAAALAAVLVLPAGSLLQSAGAPAAVADSRAMPDTDLQMLEDMDMLAAMAEERS